MVSTGPNATLRSRQHLESLRAEFCIIDGEVVILDDDGAIPVFDRLRHGQRVKPEAVLYAFDLLELDGEE